MLRKEVKHNAWCKLASICSETTNGRLTKLELSYTLVLSTTLAVRLLCLDWEVNIPSACQGNRHKGPKEPICFCQTGPPPLLERHDILILFMSGCQWNAPFYCCVNIEPHAYSKPHTHTQPLFIP